MSLLLRQFAWETRKLLSRRETYLGFAAFVAFDLIVLGMMQSDAVGDAARHYYLKNRRFAEEANFSGLTIAFFLLRHSIVLLGVPFIALAGGSSVAGEIESGTVRMVFVRPISRIRWLTLKWVVCALYTVLLSFVAIGSALALGLFFHGRGNLLVLFPDENIMVSYLYAEGLRRYCIAAPLEVLGLLTVSSVAFFSSCCRMKAATAVGVTIAVFFADFLLRTIPFFAVFQPYLLMDRITFWTYVFAPEIRWTVIFQKLVLLIALDALLFVGAWCVFSRRDLKD